MMNLLNAESILRHSREFSIHYSAFSISPLCSPNASSPAWMWTKAGSSRASSSLDHVDPGDPLSRPGVMKNDGADELVLTTSPPPSRAARSWRTWWPRWWSRSSCRLTVGGGLRTLDDATPGYSGRGGEGSVNSGRGAATRTCWRRSPASSGRCATGGALTPTASRGDDGRGAMGSVRKRRPARRPASTWWPWSQAAEALGAARIVLTS